MQSDANAPHGDDPMRNRGCAPCAASLAVLLKIAQEYAELRNVERLDLLRKFRKRTLVQPRGALRHLAFMSSDLYRAMRQELHLAELVQFIRRMSGVPSGELV